ncbi:hypothetical protein CHLNCDRAFT_141340 [Chlorella variabilis]|uniref:EamA domain-containing protein n=1 Tax=Chlorella variabilis TaxID=554065 RepID=E1ZSN7_CHLVA|nr:hypothetical protein CHLNCDRAFT_141340 [Chlorella variabilis]EFN51185.1 hypothetical protein CHLNCDRAFT_141340 [Chlorella variabilis]|eukprot:XP_005843287.1 hypothetical protein CHLNCDRAFT_141340 [Chlorella variabilis]
MVHPWTSGRRPPPAAAAAAREPLSPVFSRKRVRRAASHVLLVSVFLCLNSGLNLLNKWSLGHAGFRFPFLLSSCHMAFSFAVLAPVALLHGWEAHRRTLHQQWPGILCIGSFMALNIALNNISLLDISLSLNQIIRSAIPVVRHPARHALACFLPPSACTAGPGAQVACIMAVLIESRYPSPQEAASLVVISLGVMLAVWQGALTGKPYAIAFCVAATVCNGGFMTLSSKLMSEKLDVVRLAFYVAPVSLACLAPFYWVYEHEHFRAYYPAHRRSAQAILLASSALALCYNLAHSLMIKRISAVATTVVGEFKILALLLLSAFLLGEKSEFTPKMIAGCTLALAGFAAYSHTKLVAARQRQRRQQTGSE